MYVLYFGFIKLSNGYETPKYILHIFSYRIFIIIITSSSSSSWHADSTNISGPL